MDKLQLWGHQVEAVRKMRRYITAFKRGVTDRAALVHMPTGSGKTRVIAALARYAPQVSCALLLAPRIALRDQLKAKLDERFFRKGVTEPETLPKSVVFLERKALEQPTEIGSTVFVSTIQKLDRMFDTNPQLIEVLRKHISLLIVDEGHYEPALSWSETIRQFDVPRILFTATPFRNDYKPFDVDEAYIFSYPFHRAVRDRYLRTVSFVEMNPTSDPERFVADIIGFYNEHLTKIGPDLARVIIRCDNRNSIRKIAQTLRNSLALLPSQIGNKGKKCYVAIHEEFDNNEDTREYKSVPDPKTEEAIFWIHQFKLLEGIDDPRFQLVAMFERLRTARQLIQQVGRVIRNTERRRDAKAYVLDHSGGKQKELWDNFLSWDEAIKGEEQFVSVGNRFALRLRELQAPVEYIDREFRRKLDFETIGDISVELQLPRSVNLLQKEKGFDLNEFCRLMEIRFGEEDQPFKQYPAPHGAVVYMYLSYKNSPFLQKSYFLEFSHGVMVIRDLGEYLAFYDNSDYLPTNTPELGIGKPLSTKLLRRLFSSQSSNPRATNSYLTMVSLKNSHLGNRSIRARSFWAAKVHETTPSLDDPAQIVSSVFGYSREDTKANKDAAESKDNGPEKKTKSKKNFQLARRYVGFNRGRISQVGEPCSLDAYLEWIDQIKEIVDSPRRQYLQTFDRFAAPEKKVADSTPKNILLDLFEVQENYVTIKDSQRGISAGEEMDIEDLCLRVPENAFTLKVNAAGNVFECPMSLEYDLERQRYVIEESKPAEPEDLTQVQLGTLYHAKAGLRDETIVAYLNRTQSFRVLPNSENLIYVHGEFYKPVIKIGKEFDPNASHVGKIMFPSDKLRVIGDEKGKECLANGEGWEDGSLFSVIDNLGDDDPDLVKVFGSPQILVCDDMGPVEIADFILCDPERRLVAFIHAKASKKLRPYSASAIQEVSAQAMKNINYLSMFSEAEPNFAKWRRKWTAPKVQGFVERRIRYPKKAVEPEEIWKEIRSVIRDPLARREVWLFLGQIMSKSSLQEQLAKSGDEAVQATILLHGAMTNVASIDAKLRVFCFE